MRKSPVREQTSVMISPNLLLPLAARVMVFFFVIYIANSPDNKNTLTVELELNRFIVSRFSYKEPGLFARWS